MNSKVTKSLQILRDGYMVDFMERIYSNERFAELMMDLSAEYIEENIPLLDEDMKYELALMMYECVHVRSY